MRASPAALLAVLTLAASPAAGDVPAGFTEQTVASGLRRPVALAVAPDGTVFVAEQYTGAIRLWRNGQILPQPFATLSPVYDNANETGLLGLALSPAYAQDGLVYAFVTRSSSEQHVVRFRAQGDVGVDATPLITGLPTRGINHNGGGIAFAADGTLLVSVGDNASQTDAGRLSSLRGKLLRYRADGSIPSDNPDPSSPVWAHGLRNTFGLAVQPGTGKVFGSENGPNAADELNLIRRGGHHGWPDHMGRSGRSGYVDPLAVYTPTTAITGLAFHPGTGVAALGGSLFVAHYKLEVIRRVELGGPNGETVVSDADFVTRAGDVVGLAVGPSGALYYCNLRGDLVRVTGSGASNVPPFASISARPTSGGAPLVADLDASGSADVDGLIVSWSWDLGDGASATGPQVVHTYSTPGNYTATLTVTDDNGAQSSTSQRIDVAPNSGNPPPSAHVEDIAPAPPYKQGDSLTFTGHGHDDVNVVEHRWDFGDGSPPQVVSGTTLDQNRDVNHTYAQAGDFTVTLTVLDDQGATGVHSRQVQVGGCSLGLAGPAPTGNAIWLALLAGLLWLRRLEA